MRNSIKTGIALVLLAPALGGCASLFGSKSAKLDVQPVGSAVSGTEFAEQQIELGKKMLASGQYAAAITAFRNAKLAPQHEAAAYNGLAIAYAQIGRPDLSERYFGTAIALAPQDERYRRNLARFQNRNTPAPMMAEKVQPVPQRSEIDRKMELAAINLQLSGQSTAVYSAATTGTPAPRLVQTSSNQVAISSATAAERAFATATSAKITTRSTSANYPVRVSFSSPDANRTKHVIHVSSPKNVAERGPNYPIKVSFGSSQ